MSGRYQSKLFNFLSRQSWQLRHQSAKTWRQAKVAAVWTVQILLYPVYVTFQSARLLNRQLQQAARQVVPLLRAAARSLSAQPTLPADAPIQQLLQDLSQLEVHLPSAASSDLALALTHSAKQPHRTHTAELLVATTDLTASLQVRGMASMLGTGGLVLVTAENQILDLLTPAQQKHLTQRMAWELAGYWRQQKRLGFPNPQPRSTYLPLPSPQQNALPPIRAWRGLMAWMQRSAVAVSANLFQESRLKPQAALPSAEVGLRSAQPVWQTTEAQFYDWLKQTGQQVGGWIRAGLEASQTAMSKRSVPAGLQQFRAMLPAAPGSDAAQSLPANSRAILLPTDWLITLDRWISEIPGLKATPAGAENQLSAAPPNPAQNWLQRSLYSLMTRQPRGWIEVTLWEATDTAAIEVSLKGYTQSQQDRLQTGALSEWDADYGMTRLRRRQPAGVPFTSLDTANAEELAMVPQSWIETEAQLVEYVKHPLEQVLEWLDQGMLWVEQRFSQLWQWLKRPIS